ncbi:unnamed protein product [Protopolystoma xenopodis]|uniref:Uncharacterized protein n=1 Tax=Protopolystoma xenopodis TaxID=117903 RepID=A0A448WEF9_9PLAT|nr:unnamed protein product [Protopolystoma xenopodis]
MKYLALLVYLHLSATSINKEDLGQAMNRRHSLMKPEALDGKPMFQKAIPLSGIADIAIATPNPEAKEVECCPLEIGDNGVAFPLYTISEQKLADNKDMR